MVGEDTITVAAPASVPLGSSTEDSAPGTQAPTQDPVAPTGASSGDTQITAPTADSTAPLADWDSDDNPYKYVAQQQRVALQQREQQELVAQAQQYEQALVQQGQTPEQARATASQALQIEQGRRQMTQEREQLAEQAKPIVAQRLVAEIKRIHGIDVDANELLYDSAKRAVNSPQEMLMRADALISERKKAAFANRQKSGADSVDNGPATASPSFINDKLTPAQRLGRELARGLT